MLQIPVCVYHGSPEERAELRSTKMVLPAADRDKWWVGYAAAGRSSVKGKGRSKAPVRPKNTKANGNAKKASADDAKVDLPPHQKTTFPVVLTTYEMIIKDRNEFAAYHWGFIFVDEGHRLKNMECRLMLELKSLTADTRMVLTGTPLQVSDPMCDADKNVDLT